MKYDPSGSLPRLAFQATLHCMTGCAIGEIAGMAIGTALGLGAWTTVGLAVVLAFISGFGPCNSARASLLNVTSPCPVTT